MDLAASSTEISLVASTHTVEMLTSIDVDARARDVMFRRNQEQSPLLRLPAELRNKIYEYALGGYYILILAPKYKSGRPEVAIMPRHTRNILSGKNDIHSQALTTTCQQIRSESALLPLLLNKFITYEITELVAVVNTFTPEQRGAVRTVKIIMCGAIDILHLATWDAFYTPTKRHSLAEALQDVPNASVLTQRILQQLPRLKTLCLKDAFRTGCDYVEATMTMPSGLGIEFSSFGLLHHYIPPDIPELYEYEL